MLAVSDTGCGMDEHTRARISEPFLYDQGNREGNGPRPVHRLRDGQAAGRPYHGGHQSPARYHLHDLPARDDERPQSVDPPPETSLPVGNEKVLLVEDDEAVRAFAASVLRRVGYSIREAATPLEALAIPTAPMCPSTSS